MVDGWMGVIANRHICALQVATTLKFLLPNRFKVNIFKNHGIYIIAD